MSMSDMSGMDDMTSTSNSSTMMMTPYLHATLPSLDPLLFSSWVPSSPGAVIGASVGLFFLAVLERFLRVVARGMEGYWRRDALRRIPSNSTSTAPIRLSPTSSNSYTDTEEKYLPTSSNQHPTLSPGLSQRSQPTTSTLASTDPFSSTQRPSTSSSTIEPSNTRSPSYLPARLSSRATEARRAQRWNVPFVWRNDLARGGLEGLSTALRYTLMLSVMTFNLFYIGAIVLGAAVGETLFGRHGNVH